jgi:hypothetical protein
MSGKSKILVLVLVLALAASVAAGLLGYWPDLQSKSNSKHTAAPGLGCQGRWSQAMRNPRLGDPDPTQHEGPGRL